MPADSRDPLEPEEPGDHRPLDPGTMVDRYDQLIAFEQGVLARMRALRERLPHSARAFVDDGDIRPLQGLIERFERRREFWCDRLAPDDDRRAGTMGDDRGDG